METKSRHQRITGEYICECGYSGPGDEFAPGPICPECGSVNVELCQSDAEILAKQTQRAIKHYEPIYNLINETFYGKRHQAR